MILGMTLPVYTAIHVAISLVAIASGLIVLLGMIANRRFNLLTAFFIDTTLLTSLTGFLFPFHGITPGIIIGILSLAVLLPAIVARYQYRLAGPWRLVYVVGAVIALWFNVFILIVQLFEKVPALHALAPTQSELPFKIAQIAALVLLLVLGTFAVRKFHPVVPVPVAA